MSAYCEDCGCKMYGGLCTNCDEETFIADQFRELGESVPEAIAETESHQRQQRTAKGVDSVDGVLGEIEGRLEGSCED